jgi:1-acylglycerone phosphate reductase
MSDLKKSGIECFNLIVDDSKSVAACHAEVQKTLDGKGLDFLINNAGISMVLQCGPIQNADKST